MTFDQTPEAQQSLAMRPACDRVLCEVFGVEASAITRFDHGDMSILDRHFHIDLAVHLPNGSQVTGQEKALSHRFSTFSTFTMEFWQNRYTKEPGEFFKIAAQFYLHGYSDPSGVEFEKWMIVNLFVMLDWWRNRPADAFPTRSAGGSRAAFTYLRYRDIPRPCVFAWGRGPNDTRLVGRVKDLMGAMTPPLLTRNAAEE